MLQILSGLILAAIALISVIQVQRMIRKPKGCGRGCSGCGTSSCCPATRFPEKKFRAEVHSK